MTIYHLLSLEKGWVKAMPSPTLTVPSPVLLFAFAYPDTPRRDLEYCAHAVRYPGQDWFRQNPRTPIEGVP
jgi:hypothetical protein